MIQIFVDSGANLSPELREQYNIHLLPMALTIDDQPAPHLHGEPGRRPEGL